MNKVRSVNVTLFLYIKNSNPGCLCIAHIVLHCCQLTCLLSSLYLRFGLHVSIAMKLYFENCMTKSCIELQQSWDLSSLCWLKNDLVLKFYGERCGIIMHSYYQTHFFFNFVKYRMIQNKNKVKMCMEEYLWVRIYVSYSTLLHAISSTICTFCMNASGME